MMNAEFKSTSVMSLMDPALPPLSDREFSDTVVLNASVCTRQRAYDFFIRRGSSTVVAEQWSLMLPVATREQVKRLPTLEQVLKQCPAWGEPQN